jgi:hypothetical protein
MGQQRATRFKPLNPLIMRPIISVTNRDLLTNGATSAGTYLRAKVTKCASFQWGTMGRIGRVIREVTLRFGEEIDL